MIRVNPPNPASPDHFVCDLCTEMPQAADGGRTFTFKIRKGVAFHDVLGADGQGRARLIPAHRLHPRTCKAPIRALFTMVERVSAPDDETVVSRLKYPFGAFLPARVAPWGQCYSTCCYRA